ncbi:hypothetical protein [Sandaracinus amylolyticus]|uniref:Poly (Glycerol-phosphate) alpha-glucosyltransferase n=1 Tax=Sandaracinus amylolyticus TaxID=927083 RepID=A0A0F6SDH6_9BACT|nr:hypothetical protein [Sandaracinus amylolyticus]AKF03459.1 poly (glycerol-phosphate) alpha-glucosyltransferase [Sandaracinus amylolyticus]
MTQRRFVQGVLAALVVALLAGVIGALRTRIDERSRPDDDAARWALASLDARRLGAPIGEAPASAGAWRGDVIVTAWHRAVPVTRHVEENVSLERAITRAGELFATDDRVTRLDGWTSADDDRVRFTIECVLGEGPILPAIPAVRELGLVPLREGLVARLGERVAYLTPEQLRAQRSYDLGVRTPLAELSFGAPMHALIEQLAAELESDGDEVQARGEVRRFRSHTIAESTYPDPRSSRELVDEETLRRASVEGAQFLLRHQRYDGAWTYVYDATTDRPRREAYNLPRHAGTAYFVAQVDRLHGMPEAREGALRALSWIERYAMRRCGGNPCIESHGRVEVGSAALTVIAASEIHAKEPHPVTQRLLEGLTAFLRAQQRDDGELMHEYDLEAQRPIDVQHMYYSGEAAFALLRAHEVLGDERDLEAARRLMAHLTGAGWSFLGSRYYYGEEHWTCIAAGEARGRADSDEAIDFCRRWLEWNEHLQYREGETPWNVEGGYGVGPLLLPRLTPVGSRTEAFINTYLLLRHHGRDTSRARAVVERGLGQLLRWRWAPGPTHLFARPERALGGMPGSQVDLTSRNDFVQHAGSAWIRWAEVLREERERE